MIFGYPGGVNDLLATCGRSQVVLDRMTDSHPEMVEESQAAEAFHWKRMYGARESQGWRRVMDNQNKTNQ